MKLILLSGLDGTGKLFAAFIEALPKTIETQVVSYPLLVLLDVLKTKTHKTLNITTL
jgi:hypothetical protein